MQLDKHQKLFSLLKADGYGKLQFMPSRRHKASFVTDNLQELVERETWLLKGGEPCIYEYSLHPRFYGKPDNLAKFFLHNKSVQLSKRYEEFADFKMRIVPVFDWFLLADPVDSKDDDRVFLFNDSMRLACYLRKMKLKGSRVADLGTGTGILAFTASACGASQVLGVDISRKAIEYARLNAKLNKVDVEFKVGSLESIKSADIVVCNPPYMFSGGLCESGNGLELAWKFARKVIGRGQKLIMIVESKPGEFESQIKPVRKEVVRLVGNREMAIYEC